ncbi:MAG: hypothetical protein M5R40_21045 [Anaerolineae bacterium]|nr:hypothetical protein [Anaerolineae bacterium]
MTPTPDRIRWERLKANYKKWREQGAWIEAGLWFGFDVTHSWTVGTERLLMALVTEPEWCQDMFNHFLDVGIALLEQVWDAGYTFDGVTWPDDMGYKRRQFFSLSTYRELLSRCTSAPSTGRTRRASRRGCTRAATSTRSSRS